MPGPWKPVAVTTENGGSRTAEDTAAADRAGDAPAQFLPQHPIRSLDELIVAEPVRHRLELGIRLIQHHDTLYNAWNLKAIDPYRRGTAVNLYGPPGTGKSLAAECLASHLGRRFIDVNYAEIESRYVGDTPKNIVRCFDAAQRDDAVLIFNEADSILGSRLSNVTQSGDHSVNVSRAVMLSQLDRFAGLVIFTTNFPTNYDVAFVRRIIAHVRFPLPDPPTRRRLWDVLLPDALPLRPDVDRDVLAERSAGLSGGDLVNIVLGAAGTAVARDADERRLGLQDLLDELDHVRSAKAEVGKGAHEATVTSWETDA
jgi:SpoVK/Ycf46/Vps4 family AAA+-type ATPase